jgi:hypothetical protein
LLSNVRVEAILVYRAAADIREGREPQSESSIACCACYREPISKVCQSQSCLTVQLKRLFESSLFIVLPAKVSVIEVDPVKSALGKVNLCKEDIIDKVIKMNVLT